MYSNAVAGNLTSHDLPGHSEVHQGLGPYGPGCSYATGPEGYSLETITVLGV